MAETRLCGANTGECDGARLTDSLAGGLIGIEGSTSRVCQDGLLQLSSVEDSGVCGLYIDYETEFGENDA